MALFRNVSRYYRFGKDAHNVKLLVLSHLLNVTQLHLQASVRHPRARRACMVLVAHSQWQLLYVQALAVTCTCTEAHVAHVLSPSRATVGSVELWPSHWP